MLNDGTAADERAPLLGQSTVSLTSETTAEAETNPKDVESQRMSAPRAVLIVVALGILIFLQASNISLLTTTQSSIAADLDAFEKVSWFTSAYLVAMSSTAPLTGRLSHIFSPRLCIFISSVIFSIGGLTTSFAPSLAMFLFGRAVSGVGAAGIFTVSIIVVLQLSGPKRRGLFVGLLNTGYTIGVALGAVVAGALLPHAGWVSKLLISYHVNRESRPLWTPLHHHEWPH